MNSIHIEAYTDDEAQIEAIKAVIKAFKIKYKITQSKKTENPYKEEFVAKIKESMQQAKDGQTVKISLDDIWK